MPHQGAICQMNFESFRKIALAKLAGKRGERAALDTPTAQVDSGRQDSGWQDSGQQGVV